MMTAAVVLVLSLPLFLILVANPSVLVLTLVQVVLGIQMAFYFGPLPALLSFMYPTPIRTTGLSISYNLGVTPVWWLRADRADLAHPRERQPAVAELLLHGRRRGVDRGAAGDQEPPLRRPLSRRPEP